MSLGQKRVSIGGPPGTRWVNDTPKTMWQLIVAWENTCGRCAEYDRRIAVTWTIPFHHGCNCQSIPIRPGETAEPFVDFRAEIAGLPPGQQTRIMGAANKRLVDAGLAEWDEIVGRSRILKFHEIVAKKKLTVKQLTDIGIPKYQATEAIAKVKTPANVAALAAQKKLLEKLNALGVSNDRAAALFGRKVKGGITGSGASGSFGAGPPPPPPKPPETTPGPEAPPRMPKPLRAEKPPTPKHFEAALKPKETTVPPEKPDRQPKPLRADKPPTPPHQEAAPPKPKPPKPKPGDDWPADPEALKTVKALGGSTGAELVTDDRARWVRKRGNNPGHLRSEDQADRLYRAMGFDVPRSKLYETPGGPIKLSGFLDGARPLSDLTGAELDAARAEVRKGFAMDALLGNWDVIGLKSDNIMVGTDGRVYRIDNGGALAYRAQGKLKGGQWGPSVPELTTLRKGYQNPSAVAVFGPLTDDEVAAQIKALLKKREKILGAADPETRKALEARLDWMAEAFKTQAEAAKAEKIAAKLAAKAEAKWKAKGGTKVDPAKVRKFSTSGKDDVGTADPDTWGERHYGPIRKRLTSGEISAIKTYTGGAFSSINARLRGTSSSDSYDAKIKDIRSGLKKGSAPEAFLAWRGVFDAKAANVDFDTIAPGSVFRDAGVLSVSLKRRIAENFGGSGSYGILFRITVPKGSAGLYLNAATGSLHAGEAEFAFPPAAGFVVTGKRIENGIRIVEMEAMP